MIFKFKRKLPFLFCIATITRRLWEYLTAQTFSHRVSCCHLLVLIERLAQAQTQNTSPKKALFVGIVESIPDQESSKMIPFKIHNVNTAMNYEGYVDQDRWNK